MLMSQWQSLLLFLRDAGVDEPLDDVPANRFIMAPPAQEQAEEPSTARAAPSAATAPEQPGSSREADAALPDQAGIAAAYEAARNAGDLDALRAAVEAFDGCSLKRTARNMVFGDGNAAADLMVIGEAPGREEDATGVPFVGRSGQLLDRMLGAIGFDRTTSYITNIVFWRPPGNRTPTPYEAEVCRIFTERHIALVAPRLILTLGGPATKALTKQPVSILKARGKMQSFEGPDGGDPVPILPTLHPAFLLRNPANKRFVWQDLLAAKRMLNG